MAAVRISRDPLASDRGADVPRAQWGALLEERQRFCTQYLPKDCRNLIFFVEDGAENDWFGYGSSETYIRDALGLNPAVVDWAVAGLRSLRPEEPLSLSDAVQLGKHGGDRRSEQARVDQACNASLKYGTAEHWLARLDRDRPDLAERVRGGDLSANAAAIEAGFRKPPTALKQLQGAWKRASPDERVAFLDWMEDDL